MRLTITYHHVDMGLFVVESDDGSFEIAFVSPDDDEDLPDDIAAAMATGEDFVCQDGYAACRRDGHTRWVNVVSSGVGPSNIDPRDLARRALGMVLSQEHTANLGGLYNT